VRLRREGLESGVRMYAMLCISRDLWCASDASIYTICHVRYSRVRRFGCIRWKFVRCICARRHERGRVVTP
jgi:hypothetical protein